jgi:hypothetical protein
MELSGLRRFENYSFSSSKISSNTTPSNHSLFQLNKMNPEGQEISPLELKDKKLAKVLHPTLKHYNFQYREGLNIDHLPFNPSSECSPGGLYFCEFKDVATYFSYGSLIADVTLPDDAKVYKEACKYKANKIILSNIRPIQELTEWNSLDFQLAAVRQNGNAIRFITNPSHELHLAAVKKISCNIQFITNPSHEVQLAAVRLSGNAIRFITDPSHEVQLTAVQQNGYAIEYITEPSHEVQLAAVKQNGYAIQYITHPSYEVKLAAVKQNGYAIQYITNPSHEVQLAAVQQDGLAIQFITNPSYEVQVVAVQQNGYAIRYVTDPSHEVKKLAAM